MTTPGLVATHANDARYERGLHSCFAIAARSRQCHRLLGPSALRLTTAQRKR